MSNALFAEGNTLPWECGFSLHSATTDTAHVRWFSHCFATTDNFCLVFLQWLNTTKIKKNKTSHQETKKNQNATTQLSATTPPLGVCIFFVFLFPLRKNTLIQKGMFVLNTVFVGRYGDVVIMLESSSIFCRNCILLKGHCSSIYLR